MLDLSSETIAEMTLARAERERRQEGAFWWEPGAHLEGGRLEIYEPYDPECLYALGGDCALGIEGKDFDAAIVFNASVRPYRQVAEVHGHWGERFDRVLAPLIRYFDAFYLLECQQGGLATMRTLYDIHGLTWAYYDRDEAKRSRRMLDKLGHWKQWHDFALPNFRRAIRGQQIELRSATTLDQMGRLQYAPKTRFAANPDAVNDEHLVVTLSGGKSPDLVIAASMAYHAAKELPKYEKPEQKYRPGSMGEVMQHELLEEPGGDRRARRGRGE